MAHFKNSRLAVSSLVILFVLIACTSLKNCDNSKKWDMQVLKENIESHIDQGDYQKAIESLEALDLEFIVSNSFENDSIVEFWAVMEDGVTVPGLVSMSVDELILIENAAWVIPGTSDSQNPGLQQRWQNLAMQKAEEFNQLIQSQGGEKGSGEKRGRESF